ncbi:hypothetical protein pb186bvf_016899 [Paramecium bursaria]
MGACSGKKQPIPVQRQQQTLVVIKEKEPISIMELYASLGILVKQINRNIQNERTTQQINSMMQIKSSTDTMIFNSQQRSKRQSNEDPAFNYIIFQQLDKIGKILGDYLLIDAEFEQKNETILGELNEFVEKLESYGKFREKKQTGGTNITTANNDCFMNIQQIIVLKLQRFALKNNIPLEHAILVLFHNVESYIFNKMNNHNNLDANPDLVELLDQLMVGLEINNQFLLFTEEEQAEYIKVASKAADAQGYINPNSLQQAFLMNVKIIPLQKHQADIEKIINQQIKDNKIKISKILFDHIPELQEDNYLKLYSFK